MIILAVLLVVQPIILVSGQLSLQASGHGWRTTTAAPTTAAPTTPPVTTPPPDACDPPLALIAVKKNVIANLLNHGLLSVAYAANISTKCEDAIRCGDGPIEVPHTVPGEYHWPQIFKGSCDGLYCKDPSCLARKQIKRRQCVLVFKKYWGHWYVLGFRYRYFYHHQKCGCKQCEDIKDALECEETSACPNCRFNAIFFPNSLCTWDPSEGCICSDHKE